MNIQSNPENESPGKIRLRFSPSGIGPAGGIFIILTSGVLFTVGFVRGELASLLWGGALLFLLIFCLASVLITISLNLGVTRNLDPSAHLPLNNEETGIKTLLSDELILPGPVRRIPGVSVSYRLDYRFMSRLFRIIKPLDSGADKFTLSGMPEYRGSYTGAAFLTAGDLAGFFSADVQLTGEGHLTVFPLRGEITPGTHFPTYGGEVTPEVRRKKESSELFDLRKFYPGDDPRKLHWKLYAHSGELFLRKGEPEPPPSGIYQIVLDLSIKNLPSGAKDNVLDYIISRAAGLFCELLESGKGVYITANGGDICRFAPGEEKKLLRFLAGLIYPSEPAVRAPGRKSELLPDGLSLEQGVYLFSNPFSSSFQKLYTGLSRKVRGRGFKVLSPSPPESTFREEKKWFSFFFYETGKPGGRESSFSDSLISDWKNGLDGMMAAVGEERFHAI